MTYYEEENEVVPELGMRIDLAENNYNDKNGEYVKLIECEEDGPGSPRRCSCSSVWCWIKLLLLLTCLGLLAAVFLKWVGPFFMDKVSLLINLVFFTYIIYLCCA